MNLLSSRGSSSRSSFAKRSSAKGSSAKGSLRSPFSSSLFAVLST